MQLELVHLIAFLKWIFLEKGLPQYKCTSKRQNA
jgi:hypothetical protein